jgi:uncharacterized membrane protein YhaH (DUF805 family)
MREDTLSPELINTPVAGVISQFFSFSGRLGRGWFFTGLLVLCLLALSPALAVYGSMLMESEKGFYLSVAMLGALTNSPPPWSWLIALCLTLLTSWPYFALVAKRLHDIDVSGWWQLSWCVPSTLLGAFSELSAALILIPMVALLFIEGDKRANRFDKDIPPPDTKARASQRKDKIFSLAGNLGFVVAAREKLQKPLTDLVNAGGQGSKSFFIYRLTPLCVLLAVLIAYRLTFVANVSWLLFTILFAWEAHLKKGQLKSTLIRCTIWG